MKLKKKLKTCFLTPQLGTILISGFLSSSTSVSPHLSPSIESNCGVDSDDNQELQQIRLIVTSKPVEVRYNIVIQLNFFSYIFLQKKEKFAQCNSKK